jgi:toxin ParE1/3/4
MNVVFTDQAERDIDEAWAWYEARAPGLGRRFLDEVVAGRDRIAQLPRGWQRLDDNFRRHMLNVFPYALVYRIEEDDMVVVVVGVGHLKRGPRYWRAMLQRG